MKNVRVLDVMFSEPFTLHPAQSVVEAAILMKDIDCGILPVAEQGRPIGMITDRDITLRITAEGKDPKKTLVKSVMTKSVHTCTEDTTLEDAAVMMRQHNVSRLLVMRGHRMTGIVTLKHLILNAGDMWSAGKIIQALQDAPIDMMMPIKKSDGLSLWS